MTSTQTQTSADFRIYVASLSDYNAGRLHGWWIDVDGKDGDDIMDEVRAMLDRSSEPIAEEWAIHDHEGFGGFNVGESESFDTICNLAEAIEEHGEAFGIYCGMMGEVVDVSTFEDAYCGDYSGNMDPRRAYAEELADETMEIPANIVMYFDYESFARDLFMDGHSEESGHIFRDI